MAFHTKRRASSARATHEFVARKRRTRPQELVRGRAICVLYLQRPIFRRSLIGGDNELFQLASNEPILTFNLTGFFTTMYLVRMRREGAGTAGQRRRDDELALRWTGPDSPSNPNPNLDSGVTLKDSHLANADVPGLSEQVTKKISPQLSYSSRFWFTHIQDIPLDEGVLNSIEELLHHHFLHWLEVLSLLGQMSIASAGLQVAAAYVKVLYILKALAKDAFQFVRYFGQLMAQSAPHNPTRIVAIIVPLHNLLQRRLYNDSTIMVYGDSPTLE
ncbi:hypothetical protein B0H11DRAFT_1934721 [Mycena galericulata]|nr:hypothetical protein B0H11DRAFT_1934721 [Mycena galericulata]